MSILNKTQLLPGICKSLKTTIIRAAWIVCMELWKAQQFAAYWRDQGFMSSYRGEKIPYANHCIYVVNIITATLKARISHKEKLNFCNYPIIKPLPTSQPKLYLQASLIPLSSNVKVAAQLWPYLHRHGQGRGLWFPLHRPNNLPAQIWVSGSSSALCAWAGWPLAGSPLHSSLAWEKNSVPHLLNKVGW